MTDPDIVSPQVTDGLTQANVTVLANTPAYALAQSDLALAQSQGVLFANMVSGQQQHSTAGSAAIMKGILELFN